MTEGSPDFVSTGTLPGAGRVRAALDAAYALARPVDDGRASTVYPALGRIDPDLFGLALVGVDGALLEVGDARTPFAIMSAVKPFTFALVAEQRGAGAVLDRVGADATGLPFNSVEAIGRDPQGRTNPMVNSGAITVASLAPGRDTEQRWEWLHHGLCAFAGRALVVDDEVYRSAMATNVRNREIAAALDAVGALGTSADEAVDLYTRQSSLHVTAVDLARMGAVLADGGVAPGGGERVVGGAACRAALAAMATAGLYESSGRWLQRVGVPGKSGIGGGLVTVAPGKGAVGAYSPRLDAHGNSVRGSAATAHLARLLGLDLFAAAPP